MPPFLQKKFSGVEYGAASAKRFLSELKCRLGYA